MLSVLALKCCIGGMGVRNRLLEYSSLQMNSVGGQANSSLHIHTQTKFSEANVCAPLTHAVGTKQIKCIKFLCGAFRAECRHARIQKVKRWRLKQSAAKN